MDVWEIAKKSNALLITRDKHFTNRIRHNPKDIFGVLFIRHGNIKSETEINLITEFIQRYPSEVFQGKLVTLSSFETKIRD